MAKLRTNHQQSSAGASGNIVKVGIFGAIIGGLFFLFNQFSGVGNSGETDSTETPREEVDHRPAADFLPTSSTNDIIHHKYYSLSYSEEDEQAEWVAYQLTKQNLEKPWVDRKDVFIPDPKVKSGSATPKDYNGSGYDRGHMVPAADMSFSEEAMAETFYMSNMSPQSRNFNGGIWRELEELTRTWAKKFGSLYVVTGPVLTYEPKGFIGENEVAIPAAYFKVLLDGSKPNAKGIGFILPNEISYEPLYKFAVSIDRVEEISGLDFFPDLLTDEVEAEVEGNFNIDLWPFSKQKFEERIENWNKR
ncbi:MAG: DNA/RNA non-specific endonuclease [Saprospiraceae bacterium]